jgi:HrpA-like RNA helicase
MFCPTPSAQANVSYSKAIDPPKLEAMDTAWRTLLDLGVVEGADQKSRLTALGRHVSKHIFFLSRSKPSREDVPSQPLRFL